MHLEKVLRAPPEPRPERFIGIDRRNFGSLLHEGSDLSLESLVNDNGWPNARDLTQRMISVEVNGAHPFAHLSGIAGEIERRFELYVNRFRVTDRNMELVERDAFIRSHMIGHEMRLAVDGDGNPCSFDDCPADGWRAIIDYAEVHDGVLTIIDNKNRPAIFPNAELKLDEQLSGYVDLVRAHFPGQFTSYRQGIYYFEFGYTQLVDMTAEEIEANVFRLKARAAHKESLTLEQIAPEPGFGKCQYCDYLHSCDPGKAFTAGGGLMVTDVDQARKLAEWVLVEEEKLSAAKKALKIFTGEFGHVELDDKTLVGHSVSLDGVSYDKDKTLRILKGLITGDKLKGKLSDFTSLNLNAVKKAAKWEDVDKALEPARSPKAQPKFDFFRPATKKGVKVKKEGRKTVVAPEETKTDFADEEETKPPRKSRGKVKSGAR
jgi:hypothetical protein